MIGQRVLLWTGSAWGVLVAVGWVAAAVAGEGTPAELRQRCVDVLRQALAQGREFVKVHAAEALIREGHSEEARAAFVGEVDTAPAKYRIGVWRVMVQASPADGKGEPYRARIRAAFLDPDGPDRVHAIETLAKLDDPAKPPELIRVAREGEGVLQAFARWALANSGVAEHEQALADLLEAQDPGVRTAAAYGLRWLPTLTTETRDRVAARCDAETRASTCPIYLLSAAFIHSGPGKMDMLEPAIIARLDSKDKDERYEACEALGLAGREAVVSVLQGRLHDEDTDVRVSAANAILRILRRREPRAGMAPAGLTLRWRKEPEPQVEGSIPLDGAKVQAPCIVRIPTGGFRLFYTAVGPGKPFASCQGYILSAISDDGLVFRKEPGIRIAPQPGIRHLSLRVLAPSVARCGDGRWRMYFEARGPADQPTVICSALSDDLLRWELEEGVRLQSPGGVGGPRYLRLPDGRGRLYCINKEYGSGAGTSGDLVSQSVISAITSDGLTFALEPGFRMRDRQADFDSAGITAAEVIPPDSAGGAWTMVYSAWQDVPPGTVVPRHPSTDVNAVKNGRSDDFAAASIATDMAGYRSRIFMAHSDDGLLWRGGRCVIQGLGYQAGGLDAVHAEDMSIVKIEDGEYRMYYAACDKHGKWRIASAVSGR